LILSEMNIFSAFQAIFLLKLIQFANFHFSS
jgi:hypothetical protein